MPSLAGGRAIRVFLCFAAAYLLSYAFRSINAVIAPALQSELDLSNADLGLLSSAYFLAFACMQLPLGIWLDKYGPRRLEAGLLLAAVLGSALFAVSETREGLWAGRALIGVGVSACLMAPFKAFRLWYPIERQGQLASWMLVAGSSGALLATVPVNAMMSLIGWRGVFWVMAGLVLLAAMAIFWGLRKVELEHAASVPVPAPNTAPAGAGSGYGAIFSTPYFQRMGVLAVLCNGSFSAIQSLWAGPWMRTVLGLEASVTASLLFWFNLCLMLSYMALSALAPRLAHPGEKARLNTHNAITAGLVGGITLLALMAASAAPWTWMLWLPLAACVTVNVLIQVSVGLAFPVSQAGRASSAYNFLVFVGSFLMQWSIGLMSDAFQALGLSAAGGLRATFGVVVVLQAGALLFFLSHKALPSRH